MTKDTILVIEPDFSGHRWRYAEWAGQACVEAGYQCVIVTASANATHPLAQRLAAGNGTDSGTGSSADLQISFVDPPAQANRAGLGWAGSYVRYFRHFQHIYRTVSREYRVVLAVVQYVDYFFYALPFLGSPFGNTPWVGITMRAAFGHHEAGVRAPRRPLINAVKGQLFRRAVRTSGLKTLLTIDPTLSDWCANHPEPGAAPVQYSPTPAPMQCQATRGSPASGSVSPSMASMCWCTARSANARAFSSSSTHWLRARTRDTGASPAPRKWTPGRRLRAALAQLRPGAGGARQLHRH